MNILGRTASLALFLSLAAINPVESKETADSTAAVSEGTAKAVDLLSQSSKFLESLQALAVSGTSGGELQLENGQLVEHGTEFSVVFNRPSQLSLRMESRDGSKSTLIFDGETITIASDFGDRQIYDTTPQPGNVDESLDFMVNQAGSLRELEYLLSENLTDSLSRIESGLVLGQSRLDDISCHHVAVRSAKRDGQVWIAQGDEPAPWRILITHRNKPMNPRFWVQFDQWDFSPEISPSTFEFKPPEDARKFDYFND